MKHEHCKKHETHLQSNKKNLLIVLYITAFYMVAEFLGGYFSNSLALTADAGHMLSDVGALALSFFALWLVTKKAPVEKTFGYYRAEIFAALINGVALVFIAFFILYEAHERISDIQKVDALTMTYIALGGLIVNITGAILLHKGSKENLNIKGAFLHIIGDLLGSIGAVIAGLFILFKQLYIADTIISIIISLLILYSSINIINSAVQILMEAAPKNIDIEGLKNTLKSVKGVYNLHDLHIWSINSSNTSLSVHIVAKIENYEKILLEIHQILKDKYGIEHSTVQIEPEDFHETNCPLNPS